MTISLTLYKKIRDNKEFIIKNFYYRKQVDFKTSKQYKNFVNKLEKNNREIVPEINKKSTLNLENNNLYNKIFLNYQNI